MSRLISRIEKAREYPGDSQVNAKKIVVSFESYERTDPFIMLAEDWFDARGGFDTHPHRGFETVTIALEGSIAHKDSKGNEGLLKPGDIQWMTAGRGILHSEIAQGTEQVHSLQLWLNLPSSKKMVEPRYQDLSRENISVAKIEGGAVHVISGSFGGATSGIKNHHPATLLDIALDAGATANIPVEASYRCFIYLIEGSATIAGENVKEGSVAWFEPVTDGDSSISIVTGTNSRLLLFAGEPIRESIVQYGPFVMNTREEILQAFNDFNSGTFGD
jgi:redox-sensitive bicupin YhaK (pirin superfamily)